MRKIAADLFISLDGVVEAPDQRHFPYFNDQMGAAVDATLGAADTVLFGALRPQDLRQLRRGVASNRPARSSRR